MTSPDLEPLRLLINNAPVDDFCGLSRNEMHHLLYEPFSEHSPVQLRTDISDETLSALPFFRLAEEFLKIIQREGSITLTPLGALQRKVLHELYEHGFIFEELIERDIRKLTREHDAVAIHSMHLTVEITGLVRKAKGKLTLTKRGGSFLRADARQELFILILRSFVEEFNWGYNDRYTALSVGQLGWGFSVYLQQLFGDAPRPMQFYADKYATAFPALVDRFNEASPERIDDRFARCYCIRTFDRFLEWFGLVEIERRRMMEKADAIVRRTKTMVEVFEFPDRIEPG
jgi:hypothetical protein